MKKVKQFWADTIVKFWLDLNDSDNPPMHYELEAEANRIVEHLLINYEIKKSEEILNKMQELKARG